MDLSARKLASQIQQIHAENPTSAEARIESFLGQQLQKIALSERIELVQKINSILEINHTTNLNNSDISQDIIADLFLLFLGKQASAKDLESEAQLKALARSLNTIFDTLNRLIDVINTTLKGRSSQQETIRGLIGKSIMDQSSSGSMVEYLGQIEQAFLTSQKALQEAAHVLVKEILEELNPDRGENGGRG